MKEMYSDERNVQILIGLLKANNIKKIIASPGSTNIPFVMSCQNDGGFEMYSCVDERSAAYMAVGMAAESGEPVVLTCTGATASRNYFSGLTEAFYRKLPILAVTSTRPLSNIGNHIAQVIDRTVISNDVVKLSIFAPLIRCHDDEWDCQLKINKAIAALRKDGGGPVHINLETESSFQFSITELKRIKTISYITHKDNFPLIPKGRIAVFIGSHLPFTPSEIKHIEIFCECYNGAVFCDHTSNYNGKYRVLASLMGGQDEYQSTACNVDLMIYIGEVTGSYDMLQLMPKAKKVWRVSEDGEMRDPSQTLSKLFHMSELEFFSKYNGSAETKKETSFYEACNQEYKELYASIPDNLPLSNIWVAYEMASKMPENCIMHYGILNSLRSWNFFKLSNSIRAYCNVGGFGIDGNMSTLIGASLCNKDRLYFGVVGDLSFFYDMNSLGNRHVGNNVRILVIDNGKGMEFRNYTHPVSKFKDSKVDAFIAAGGHYACQSASLVKHFAQDLGYEYLMASTKKEVQVCLKRFLTPEITEKPMVFVVYTEQKNENEALYTIHHLKKNINKVIINLGKQAILKMAGKETLTEIKNLIRKR